MENRKLIGNTHVLDEDTLQKFEKRYAVSVHNDVLVFDLTYQNYSRAYEIGKKFNVMNEDKTKMTINAETSKLWSSDPDMQKRISIFRLQNVINRMIVNKETVTESSIRDAIGK